MTQLADFIPINMINRVLPKRLTHLQESIKIQFITCAVDMYRNNIQFGIINFSTSLANGSTVIINYEPTNMRLEIHDIVEQVMSQSIFKNFSRNENVFFYRFLNIFRSLLSDIEWTTTQENLLRSKNKILSENVRQYIEYRAKMDTIDRILAEKLQSD